MTHLVDTYVPDRRAGRVVLRGVGWGAVAGAVSGALSVTPLVGWNGPPVALVVYPALAAVPGSIVGSVVGAIAGAALAVARPVTTSAARGIGALTGLLCAGWLVFVVPWFGLWVLVLAVGSGALLGPRVSARPNDAAAAAGTAFPGWSRAPGR